MEINELWLPIAGFEGKYEVSNFGRVKSLNYHRENRAVILTGAVDRYGYHKVTFCLRGIQTSQMVHRLVAAAFLAPASTADAISVNHVDGDKRNNRADNLEWLSMSANVKHAYKTGLSDCKGEKSGMSKLTDAIVLAIREDYKTIPTRVIARKYNISTATIAAVATGKTWSHLPLPDYSQRPARIIEPVSGFVEAAAVVHAGRYDYSKVDYVNSRTAVVIICRIHGEFSQKPKCHIVGQGCPRCAVIQRKVSLLNKKAAVGVL